MVTGPTWPVQEWVILMRKIWNKLGWTFFLKGRLIMGTWVHRACWGLLRRLALTLPESDLSWYEVCSGNVLYYFRSWPEVAQLACQCGNFTVRQDVPYRGHGGDLDLQHVMQDIRVALVLKFEQLPYLEEAELEHEQEQQEEQEEELEQEQEQEHEQELEQEQQQEHEEEQEEEVKQQQEQEQEHELEQESEQEGEDEVCCYCFG